MHLLGLLQKEASARGLLSPADNLDAALVFKLVRDMPYMRASDRKPETIIKEWRGTCSGKHYLLKDLFGELGLQAQVIACTAEVRLDLESVHEDIRRVLKSSNGRVVDVHNYLRVNLEDGREMVVDATWPLYTRSLGFVVNETFVLGEDQQIAVKPLQNWVVTDSKDPQSFKKDLLVQHFSRDELITRDQFIRTLSKLLFEITPAVK